MYSSFRIIMLFFTFFFSRYAFSQTKEIDSLKQALAKAKEDTVKINILNELSYSLYMSFQYDSSIKYGTRALEMSKKMGYKKGEGYALLYISCSYGDYRDFERCDSFLVAASSIAHKIKDKRLIGLTYHAFGGMASYNNNNAEAFRKFDTALSYYREVGDKKLIALVMRVFGQMYNEQFNYPEAILYTYKALKYFEEVGDESKIAECYYYIGYVNKEHKNYPEALKNYLLALNLYESLGKKPDAADYNNFDIALTLTSIGEIYLLQGFPAKAIDKYTSASKIFEENVMKLKVQVDQPLCYAGIARAYELIGDTAKASGNIQMVKANFSKARQYYDRALKMNRELGVKNQEAEVLILLGNLSVKEKDYKSAENLFQKALLISGSNRFKYQQRDSYLNLSNVYEITGDTKKGFEYYKKYILYRDSLVNEESIRKSEGHKLQFEFEKKEDQIKLLSIENKLKTTLVQKQRQQKNFAYISIAAILLAGGYGFYRYRRRKRLQSQQAVLNERLRISSELHDEVGATLSGIAMYSHLTREQMKTGQAAEIEKSLNIIQQSSAQMVDKLSDIVWLINPEQDSLQKLLTRLEEYATDMAAIKNIQVKISVPEKIAEINLPVESRRNIYLFCKEAINNAVKYSQATLLELTIKELDGKLEFSVTDNGKGFDAVMVRRGNGLENMQKRADEIGAKLILQSKENEGASVSLQCKIT